MVKRKKIFNTCKSCGNGFITTDKTAKYCLFCTPEPTILKEWNKPHKVKPTKKSKKPRNKPKVAREHKPKPRVNSHLNTRRFVIFERDEFRCAYCGKSSIEDKTELHLEHIQPRCKGGTNNVNNIITSCSTCNTEKSDTILSVDVLNRLRNELIQRNEAFFNGYDVDRLTVELDRYYKVRQ